MTTEEVVAGDVAGAPQSALPEGDAAAALPAPRALAPKAEPEPTLASFVSLVKRALAEESVRTGNRFSLDLPAGSAVDLDRWETAAFVGADAGTRRGTIVSEAVATWLWCLVERRRLDAGEASGNWYLRVQGLLADAATRSQVLQVLAASDEGEGDTTTARKLALTRQKLDEAAAALVKSFAEHGGSATARPIGSRKSMAQRVKRVAVEVSKRAAIAAAVLMPLWILLAVRAYVLVTPTPQFDLEDLSIAVPLVDARQQGDVFQGTVTEVWEDFSALQKREKTAALLRKLQPAGTVRVVLSDPFGKVVADAQGDRVTLR